MNCLKLTVFFVILLFTVAGCYSDQWTTAEQQKGSHQERQLKAMVADRIAEAQGGAESDYLYSFYTLDDLGAPSFRNLRFFQSDESNGAIICGEILFGRFDDHGSLMTNLIVINDTVNIGTKDDRCGPSVDACHESWNQMRDSTKAFTTALETRAPGGNNLALQQKLDTAKDNVDSTAAHCDRSEGAMFVVESNRKMLHTLETLYRGLGVLPQ